MKKILSKLSLLFFPLLLIACYNIVFDPYAVLRKDLSNQKIEPNSQFLKLDYLLKNPEKYDSFVFGDSRSSHLDVTKIPIGKFYNLYYSASVPQEWFQNVEFMLKKGVRIKNILVGLGGHSFLANAESHRKDLLRKPYPQTFDEKLNFYKSYLFAWPNWQVFNAIRKQNIEESTLFDIYSTGMALQDFVDKRIEQDPKAHTIKFEEIAKCQQQLIKKGYRIDTTTQTIAALKSLCAKHGIRIDVFIHPSHQIQYFTQDM